MLVLRTYLGPSKIHGMGLFAAEPIPKGATVWKFMPAFDLLYTAAQVESLPVEIRDEFMHYSYFNARSGHFVYCIDNSRFVNHSLDPNTVGMYDAGDLQGYDVACRAIAKDEEITCNYETFDGDYARKFGR